MTRDTRVTNHTYTDGRAVPFQSILAAGTTVLVDKTGSPVVRCRCGNPLAPAIHIPEARCTACPPDYTPPEQCDYAKKVVHKRIYRDDYYSNDAYDEVFITVTKTGPFRDCYRAYPDPPPVEFINIYEEPLLPVARAALLTHDKAVQHEERGIRARRPHRHAGVAPEAPDSELHRMALLS